MVVTAVEMASGQIVDFLKMSARMSIDILERHQTEGYEDFGEALLEAISDDQFAQVIEEQLQRLEQQPLGGHAVNVLSEEISAATQRVVRSYELGFWGRIPDMLETIAESIAGILDTNTAGRIIAEAVRECIKIARARLDE